MSNLMLGVTRIGDLLLKVKFQERMITRLLKI